MIFKKIYNKVFGSNFSIEDEGERKCLDCYKKEKIILEDEEKRKELRKELNEIHAYVYKMKTPEIMDEIIREKSEIWKLKHKIELKEQRLKGLELGYDIIQKGEGYIIKDLK